MCRGIHNSNGIHRRLGAISFCTISIHEASLIQLILIFSSKTNILECTWDPFNTFCPPGCCPLPCNPELLGGTSAPGKGEAAPRFGWVLPAPWKSALSQAAPCLKHAFSPRPALSPSLFKSFWILPCYFGQPSLTTP